MNLKIVTKMEDCKTSTVYEPCKDSKGNLYIPMVTEIGIVYLKIKPFDELPVIDNDLPCVEVLENE